MRKAVIMLFLLLVCRLSGAAPLTRQDLHQPTLELKVPSHSVCPGDKNTLDLNAYNEKSILFSAFRLRLPDLVSTHPFDEKADPRIQALALKGLVPGRTWRYSLAKTFPNKWAERLLSLPKLEPGAYLIVARGKVAEKRAWLLVTDIALISHRSRQELLVYAAHLRTGRPIAGLALTGDDGHGRRVQGTTDANGVWRTEYVEQTNHTSDLWIYGEQDKNPAFLLSISPTPPKPFRIYSVTDRPVYRPGNVVRYKGTVRQRFEANAPGGLTLRPFVAQSVTVEVRDAGDAMITRKSFTTNGFGSYEGQLQLAREPMLGTWRILTRIGDFHSEARFDVKAYRKPEFSLTVSAPAAHYASGAVVPMVLQARYYFGQPVADATITYTVSFEPESTPYGKDPEPTEPYYEGHGITDADGMLKLQIKTRRLPMDRRLTVHAIVTDSSRRSEAADGGVLITAAQFRLTVETDKSGYQPGDTIRTIVHARDYDGVPVSTPVRVRLLETMEDSEHQLRKEITERTVRTGKNGDAFATFVVPRPGDLEVVADAVDPEGNATVAGNSVWVAGERTAGDTYPELRLTQDRQSYSPGQTAKIMVDTSLTNVPEPPKRKHSARYARPPKTFAPRFRQAWALVTVQGERLYAHQVVSILGHSTIVNLPIVANYGPSVDVQVTILQDQRIYEEHVTLNVPRTDDRLTVKVMPDQDTFKPGTTVAYTLTTLNAHGAPVPAELSFGVVDAGIYAIAPENAPVIETVFGGGQEVRVQTDFSFTPPQLYGKLAELMTASAGTLSMGESALTIPVRRHFEDTGYWNAFVTTDRAGVGHVSFTLPENLTTWRATAHAITLATQYGSVTQDTVASTPLLVRLELPRFYVQGDRATVSAIVHNYTSETRLVKALLEAAGAEIEGEAAQVREIPANGQQRVDWIARILVPTVASVVPVPVTDPASPPSPVAGVRPETTVRFTVRADGGPGARDAMELTIPSTEDGVRMADVQAGVLQGETSNISRDISHLPAGATLTLTLTPSLASAIIDPLKYLTSYPYGCAEQTMSAFLPDIAVARAFKRLNYANKAPADLDMQVNLGLQRLYRYQHADGGWNWWEADETDPDMTAYVLWGLVEARDAGFLVDGGRITRGTDALLKLLKKEREWSRRADWILALTVARPSAIVLNGKLAGQSPIMDLYDNRAKLDDYGLASLALALMRLKDLPQRNGTALPAFRTLALEVAHEIEAKVQVRGTTAFWPAAAGGYSWRSDDVMVTAHVLRAIVAVEPASALLPQGIRWLIGNRTGPGWASTRDTAEAVYALAAIMEQTHELKPNDHIRVSLDGAAFREFAVSDANVFDPPTVLTFRPEDLADHHHLEVSKDGPGISYLSTATNYVAPSEAAKSISRGIAVRRRFTLLTEDPSHSGPVPSGENIEVEIEVTADANYRYVLLEDPIPAGCEVEEGTEGAQDLGTERRSCYVRQEVRDDRVAFLCDELPKGRSHFHYRLHAETPGDYRILPSSAALVYFPEIRGASTPVRVGITEK